MAYVDITARMIENLIKEIEASKISHTAKTNQLLGIYKLFEYRHTPFGAEHPEICRRLMEAVAVNYARHDVQRPGEQAPNPLERLPDPHR